MNLHLYVPSLIMIGISLVMLLVGPLMALANYGDDRPGPNFWFMTGILSFYGSFVVFFIAIGMQIAHF